MGPAFPPHRLRMEKAVRFRPPCFSAELDGLAELGEMDSHFQDWRRPLKRRRFGRNFQETEICLSSKESTITFPPTNMEVDNPRFVEENKQESGLSEGHFPHP